MAACSRKTLKFLRNLCVYGKTNPYGKFSKFCSESFHRDTDRRVVFNFLKIWKKENGKILRCLFNKKQNKISPGSPAVAAARIGPKICQGQPPTMHSECSRINPNRFTFGGVTAERVNTAKTRREVNLVFC